MPEPIDLRITVHGARSHLGFNSHGGVATATFLHADFGFQTGDEFQYQLGNTGAQGTGWPGGGNPAAGASLTLQGCGYTDFRRSPYSRSEVLILGGGAGGTSSQDLAQGGDGGHPSGTAGSGEASTGGQGGSQTSGGAGGSTGTNGQSGGVFQGGQGGADGSFAGGGGGGGWFGGGGGSAETRFLQSDRDGGGGGGSSYVHSDAVDTAFSTINGSNPTIPGGGNPSGLGYLRVEVRPVGGDHWVTTHEFQRTSTGSSMDQPYYLTIPWDVYRFTDFSEYPTGSMPPNWAEAWRSTGSWSVVEDANRLGGKRLSFTSSDSGRDALVWDALGQDADIDIVGLVRGLVSTADKGALVGRVRGSSGSETSVSVVVSNGQLRLRQYSAGSLTHLGDGVPVPVTTGVYHWIRLRLDGSTAQAKFWTEGDPEPAAWTVEATTTVTDRGRAGAFNFSTGDDWDALGHYQAMPSEPAEADIVDVAPNAGDQAEASLNVVTVVSDAAPMASDAGVIFAKLSLKVENLQVSLSADKPLLTYSLDALPPGGFFEIERNGEVIGSTTETSYHDLDAPDGSITYRVRGVPV